MGNCDNNRNFILFSGDVERGVGEPTVPPTTPSLSIAFLEPDILQDFKTNN
jgi:hypothetical protein